MNLRTAAEIHEQRCMWWHVVTCIFHGIWWAFTNLRTAVEIRNCDLGNGNNTCKFFIETHNAVREVSSGVYKSENGCGGFTNSVTGIELPFVHTPGRTLRATAVFRVYAVSTYTYRYGYDACTRTLTWSECVCVCVCVYTPYVRT